MIYFLYLNQIPNIDIIKNNIPKTKLLKYIKINKKHNNIPNPNSKISLSFIYSSPRFNLALEKTKNYKFRHTKLNYLRISNCEIKNSYFFSNTNKNFIDYSLNNICSLEVRE